MSNSFHRDTDGEMQGGSSIRDFKRCMKAALGTELFSLKIFSAEDLGEGSFNGDYGRYVKKGSEHGHFCP